MRLDFPFRFAQVASWRASAPTISSHIGDEYKLNNPDFTRFDLTYEALEGIVGATFSSLRVYGGGDYIYHNVTTDIDPGTVRGGADFIAPGSFSIGTLDARFIAGAELKSARDLAWKTAKSAIAGIQLSRSGTRSPSMQIFVELFSGPSNAGQFYRTSERYIGIGGYITP